MARDPKRQTTQADDAAQTSDQADDTTVQTTVQHADDARSGPLESLSLRLFDSAFSDHGSDESSDTDLEVDDLAQSLRRVETRLDDHDVGQHTYTNCCRQLHIRPINVVLKQLWCRLLDLRYMGLDCSAAKSLSLALLKNSHVEIVDLEGNNIGDEGCVYVCEMMLCNNRITTLNLSQNSIGSEGAAAVGETLFFNSSLIDLDLSHNGLKDCDADFISQGLAENKSLQWLDLGGNMFSLDGLRSLGWALKLNNTLCVLDLSWNHIRRKGAVWLCKGLVFNQGLESLNLAWNGLGYEGCLALREVLATNTTLRHLDISNNRIDWKSVPFICLGLRNNTTLESLSIGQNTITMDGCYNLIDIASRDSSALTYIGFEGIPINSKVAFKAEDLASVRDFTMTHGGILFTKDLFGICVPQEPRKEDPVALMVRFLSRRGIRVVDLFRSIQTQTESGYTITKENFIRGLQRVQVPLDEADMNKVIKRFSNRKQFITYRDLAIEVRNQHREYMMADKRKSEEERKRRRERRLVLAPDLPGFAIPAIPHYPTPYSLTDRGSSTDRSSGSTPRQSLPSTPPTLISLSGKLGKTTPLPTIRSPTIRSPKYVKRCSLKTPRLENVAKLPALVNTAKGRFMTMNLDGPRASLP